MHRVYVCAAAQWSLCDIQVERQGVAAGTVCDTN